MSDFDPATVSWVLNEDDLEHLLEAIAAAAEVIPDLETTGLDEHATAGGETNGGVAALIVLASLTLPTSGMLGEPTTWVVPLAHPDSPWLGSWRRTWRKVAVCIRENEKPVTNANVPFDVRWTKAHTGVDLSHLIVWDTMVSSHMLDENSSTKLKERAPATFGVTRWDDWDLSVPGAALRVPMFDLGLYAARDTYWTWRLACNHRELMYPEDEPMTPDETEVARLGRLATWCSMPTVATLASIEIRGMVLDQEWTKAELVKHQDAAASLFEKLSTRYPVMDPALASFAPTSNWFRDWSQQAVDLGELVVAEMTPTGRARWSKAVLIRQARRSGSEVAAMLLEYRGHSKKAEFLTSWLGYQTPLDTVHSTYNIGSVVTGRLSSSGPNMQQVTAVLKPAWIPTAGYVFADLDYSQIEMRTAAFISRCQPMIEAFRRGDDLHALLAAQITGRSDITAEERQHAKAGNFGFLFGQSAFGFQQYAETAYDISFTMEESVQIRSAFFSTWDGIAEWHTRAMHRARTTGQVTSPIGRIRRLPEIWDGNEKLAGWAERASINSPVQGFASDLMNIASASIEGMLPGIEAVAGARIVGTVHDDILVEVPAHDWKAVTRACQMRMENLTDVLARMDCTFDVPLAAAAKVGTRWGLDDVGTM